MNTASSPKPTPIKTVRFTRTVKAPRQLVWDVWTKAEHLANWFSPNGFTVEGVESDLPRDWRAVVEPLEAAGDHQMEDDEDRVVHFPDDPFAEPSQISNVPAFDVAERRIDRTQEKRAGQAHGREPLAEDPRAERMQIQLDVRQFGHGASGGDH